MNLQKSWWEIYLNARLGMLADSVTLINSSFYSMENRKISYPTYFVFHEILYDTASSIMATYIRIMIKNADHPDNDEWDIQFKKWFDYKSNLALYLGTEEEANAETSRVMKVLQELEILEDINDLEIHTDGITEKEFRIR